MAEPTNIWQDTVHNGTYGLSEQALVNSSNLLVIGCLICGMRVDSCVVVVPLK